jgi:hypothetical protein
MMSQPEISHIEFVRSGGLVGATLAVSINLASLSKKERDTLIQLIEKADFFNLPPELADTTSTADAFDYVISASGPHRKHRVRIRTDAPPKPLQELIDYLTTVAKATAQSP